MRGRLKCSFYFFLPATLSGENSSVSDHGNQYSFLGGWGRALPARRWGLGSTAFLLPQLSLAAYLSCAGHDAASDWPRISPLGKRIGIESIGLTSSAVVRNYVFK